MIPPIDNPRTPDTSAHRWKLAIALAALLAGTSSPAQSIESDTGANDAPEAGRILTLETLEVTPAPFAPGEEAVQRSAGTGFLPGENLLTAPRTVDAFTEEELAWRSVRGLEDLERLGANLGRPSIFGIANVPFFRGSDAGLYFNGMRRLQQQNERRILLDSAESITLTKGPAPAGLGVTSAGGYIDMQPARPGRPQADDTTLELTLGSDDLYRLQADTTVPVGSSGEDALRFRLSAQTARSPFRFKKNNFIHIYGSGLWHNAAGWRIFSGFEATRFDGNELAGYNRVTQALIDDGTYLIGTPPASQTSPETPWNGTVDIDRFLADFSVSLRQRPDITALVVPTDVFEARFGDPSTWAPGSAPAQARFLEGDGYQYTPEYFEAGGEVFTGKLDTGDVLSDERDHAQSTGGLYFLDATRRLDPDRDLVLKFFSEYATTDKEASYGFSNYSESWVAEARAEYHARDARLLGRPLEYVAGVSLRYEGVTKLIDFAFEPFNRRDIRTAEIPPTTVLRAGEELGWRQGPHNESDLWLTGLFTGIAWKPLERLTATVQLRAERADFSFEEPEESGVENPGPDQFLEGHEHYANGSLSLSYELGRGTHAYATVQTGTVLEAGIMGDVNRGEGNFANADLYEAGLKATLLDERLFASLAFFYTEKLSLAETPLGQDETAFRGRGVEFEIGWAPTGFLRIDAFIGAQRHEALGGLPFRTAPLTEEELALFSGALQFDFASMADPPGNPDNARPGFPEITAGVAAFAELGGGFRAIAELFWRDAFFANWEHTLKVPSSAVVHAEVRWDQGPWTLGLRVENLFDERWFRGTDGAFASNALIVAGEPRQWEFSAAYRF